VEKIKSLTFFNEKGKDTITAMDFIRRIDDLAKANNWMDTSMYYNLPNPLRGKSRKWLFSMVDMENEESVHLKWFDI
jgi:hypothetical protein